jgi:hypothetical protein
MTTFETRERAFEAKYAHDEETRFLVTARRDKLFAHWLAERLNLPGDPLVKAILAAPSGAGHDAAVLKLAGDTLSRHDRDMDPAELHRVLTVCGRQALEQFLATQPSD